MLKRLKRKNVMRHAGKKYLFTESSRNWMFCIGPSARWNPEPVTFIVCRKL